MKIIIDFTIAVIRWITGHPRPAMQQREAGNIALRNLDLFDRHRANDVSVSTGDVEDLILRHGLSPRNHRTGSVSVPALPTGVRVGPGQSLGRVDEQMGRLSGQISELLTHLEDRHDDLRDHQHALRAGQAEIISRIIEATQGGEITEVLERVLNSTSGHATAQAEVNASMDEVQITVQELTDQFLSLKHTVAANDTKTKVHIVNKYHDTRKLIESTGTEVSGVIRAEVDKLTAQVQELTQSVAELKRPREEESDDVNGPSPHKRARSNEQP